MHLVYGALIMRVSTAKLQDISRVENCCLQSADSLPPHRKTELGSRLPLRT